MEEEEIQSILMEVLSSCEEKLELGGNELPLFDLFNSIYYTFNLQM